MQIKQYLIAFILATTVFLLGLLADISGCLLFAQAHKRTRAKVERGIGQLKRRFSVLQKKICMKPGKACRVILACGILHNICKNRNIPLPPDVPDDYHNDDQQDHNDQQNAPVAGLRYRDNFCNTYF